MTHEFKICFVNICDAMNPEYDMSKFMGKSEDLSCKRI